MSMHTPLHGAEFAPRSQTEREPRLRTLIGASMDCAGLPDQDVFVRNVSEHGMGLISHAMTPRCGEVVHLRLRGSHVLRAQVRWARGDDFGVLLADPLDMATLGLSGEPQ
ncbi:MULTISPECIES: PilZ domain-containing protein [unclassified Novosphingobium]|uniref:PilZ domain-containing protein n=1 Tax=unclassified Novosphingobium TaxID=2644732 RepID=UPI00059F9A7E|nr:MULTISPECIES: PilZ domain-containing protein [unclassified Novosphingobium]GFM30190.1 uncharacterized protein PY1_contig-08-769 [Novosphingobium sp. PY1]